MLGRGEARWKVLAAVVCTGLALGAIALAVRQAKPAPRAGAETEPGWSLAWTPGSQVTYAFAWTTRARAAVTESSTVDAAADLEGQLVALPRTTPDGMIVALRLRKLSRHSMQAMGQRLLESDAEAQAQLEAQAAWGVVDASGRIERLRFPADASRLFRDTMTKVVVQMQLSPPARGAADWTATEPGPEGNATAAYHGDGLEGTRRRTGYVSLEILGGAACEGCRQELHDEGRFVIDPRGLVGSLEDTESLRVMRQGREALDAKNHFTLRLLEVGRPQAEAEPMAQGTVDVPLGGPAVLSPADERAVLEHEAAGFTEEALDAAIDRFATKGESPADKTWLVHARAYLKLHPEALEAMGRKLMAADATSRGRNMMMQVLAVVGSPRAQEIMVSALDAARALESARSYGLLMQKLGVVERPSPATASYVEAAYRDAHGRGEQQAALNDAAALGGVAGHLARAGDDLAARRIVSRLEGDLRSASTPEDRRGLILALRNAGAAGDPDVRAFATDPSSDVRGEVARSLGDVPTPEARGTLGTLALDRDQVVATSALQSLDRDAPTAADVHGIAVDVLSGATAPVLDATFVDFFAGHTDPPDDARAVFAFVLARTKNPELARRVRALLERLSS